MGALLKFLMVMETTLIVSDECPSCKLLLDALKAQGTLSKYRVLNVESPEGKELVSKLGLKAVPDCIMIRQEAEGNMARRCTDKEMAQVIDEAAGKSGT
jgi:predicted thioredoxin/glutaredoxin